MLVEFKKINLLKKILKYGIIPLFLYFIIFCILTFPVILNFSSHLIADTVDGYQNYWNLWWVNKSITELHQLPWYTNYLHYPGTTLIGHTLNPFNGLLGIIFSPFFTLLEINNIIVIFSFVVGGLTSFLLAYHLSKSYFGSLVGGFIFTFSSYHFAHAEGHLQLVALEWIPLFILYWLLFLSKPTVYKAFFSSLALFLVILSDYYYFFYCVATGTVIFVWKLARRDISFDKKFLIAYIIFITTSLLTSGILVFSLLYTNIKDPLLGAHNNACSLDVLSLFFPGAHWRFANLTEFYWKELPCATAETSVFLGFSTMIIAIYAWTKRKKLKNKHVSLIFLIFLFFLVFSFGPDFHIAGIKIDTFIPMPYKILEIVLPVFKLSGVPIRMMVMVFLCIAIIFSIGISHLIKTGGTKRFLGLVLLILLFFEYLPSPLPQTTLPIPKFAKVLEKLPTEGAVLDLYSLHATELYLQTLHRKPIVFGYVSRLPRSVYERDIALLQLIINKQYTKIYKDHKVRYILANKQLYPPCNLKPVYFDELVNIYDIKSCALNKNAQRELLN